MEIKFTICIVFLILLGTVCSWVYLLILVIPTSKSPRQEKRKFEINLHYIVRSLIKETKNMAQQLSIAIFRQMSLKCLCSMCL